MHIVIWPVTTSFFVQRSRIWSVWLKDTTAEEVFIFEPWICWLKYNKHSQGRSFSLSLKQMLSLWDRSINRRYTTQACAELFKVPLLLFSKHKWSPQGSLTPDVFQLNASNHFVLSGCQFSCSFYLIVIKCCDIVNCEKCAGAFVAIAAKLVTRAPIHPEEWNETSWSSTWGTCIEYVSRFGYLRLTSDM